ncbi:MAG: aldolase/citrate lyase family protein [Dehalococcoidia bacterium]|jgi:4-hydroxy-2-oxoheptanedioate aldolase|nr:aldolase/citrate lyase family protein [Dehalococcoidia bacterium]MDP7085219.1 aldolase/citrate lyase family protein [Dehalococcoidia bacterium]MDP7201294.1 aldolase/citrate lyase family protein [Dehalococcoidia bacterium]HJN86842.1 aldolase/citrate lyase family protein [Dehalococcoidia bacterium]
MPASVRYNKVIDLLEQDKTVFCSGMVWNGNLDDLTFIADSDYDMLIIEMEHQGFSLNDLRLSLQFLLNRKRIAGQGNLQADPVPMVRIPPNLREHNQWVAKQALDTGVYGLVLPHLNTVEDAQAAVVAARYPQVPGVADFEPQGERGWWQRIAPRYWGLTPQEYYDAADLWPLDQDGNILLMGIIEEPEGVKNIRDILRQARGIGAIWAGPGDMSVAMGHRGNAGHPEVQETLLKILAACKDAGVPCAVGAAAAEVPMRLEQGFRIVITPPEKTTRGLAEGRRLSGR